jgi:signal transduction histidine kinase
MKTRTAVRGIALLMVVATLTLGIFSLFRAIGTVGKPFAGFFFGPNLLVSITQRSSWPGIQAGMKSLDRIAAVNGVVVADGVELSEKLKDAQPGDLIQYRIVRGKLNVREFSVPLTRYTFNDFLVAFLAPFLMGTLFLFFGCILYFKQPSARGSMVYLAFSCGIAAFCMTIYEAYTTFTFFRVTLLYPLIGAISVHLFARFPMSRMGRPRVWMGVVALYIFAATLVVWRQVALGQAAESIFLSRLSSTYILLVLAADGFLLTSAFLKAPNHAVRDRIRVIGIGLIIASSVVALWSLNFILVTESFYLDEGVLLASVFPLFMAYAVLRKNVFDLDHVIRQSLSFGVAGFIVLTLYLAVIGALRQWLLSATLVQYEGWIFFVLVVFGAALFNLLRLKVNQAIHGMFFTSEYDPSAFITQLDRALESRMSRIEIIEHVGKKVVDLLQLEKGTTLCPPNALNDHVLIRTFQWNSPPDLERWIALFESEKLWNWMKTETRPVTVDELAENHPDEFRQSVSVMRSNGLEMIIPFVASGVNYGVMLLGRRFSKGGFEHVDFVLLRSVGARVATLLENANLLLRTDQQARLAALGEMSSLMIHDIKNPLSTIRTAAGSLKKKFEPGDKSHELAMIIEDEVDRMNQTIAEILTYAKPSGLDLSPTNLNQLVREIADRLRPTFETAKVRLDFESCPEPSAVTVDATLVRRAIENLLVNAKEATRAGGWVRIATRQDGDGNGHAKFLVVVEDNGPGMDSSVREKIFRPFYTTKPGGSGLGLALVKQIVAQHNGEVELETRPQFGTKFTLHFPKAREPNS